MKEEIRKDLEKVLDALDNQFEFYYEPSPIDGIEVLTDITEIKSMIVKILNKNYK